MCVSVSATMGVSSSKPKMKRTHTHTLPFALPPSHTHTYMQPTPHTSLDNQPPALPRLPIHQVACLLLRLLLLIPLVATQKGAHILPRTVIHQMTKTQAKTTQTKVKAASNGRRDVEGVTRGGSGAAKLGASVAATKEVKLLEPNGVRNPQPIHVQTCPLKRTLAQRHTHWATPPQPQSHDGVQGLSGTHPSLCVAAYALS